MISKNFTSDSLVIMELCKIFEEGKDKKITKENIKDKNGILSFIKSALPLINEIGLKVNIEDKFIELLIRDFYPMISDL